MVFLKLFILKIIKRFTNIFVGRAISIKGRWYLKDEIERQQIILLQNDNDINKSIDWLRKKGLSVAAKKSGRVAAEGLVGVHINNNQACIIEINSI